MRGVRNQRNKITLGVLRLSSKIMPGELQQSLRLKTTHGELQQSQRKIMHGVLRQKPLKKMPGAQ